MDKPVWAGWLFVTAAQWLELAWMELYQFGGKGIPALEIRDILKILVYSGDPALDAKEGPFLGFSGFLSGA